MTDSILVNTQVTYNKNAVPFTHSRRHCLVDPCSSKEQIMATMMGEYRLEAAPALAVEHQAVVMDHDLAANAKYYSTMFFITSHQVVMLFDETGMW